MTDLTTRAAKLLWAKLPAPQTCPDEIDEAARAVVKLVLDEAAKVVLRYAEPGVELDYGLQDEIRAIRALGVQS